MTTPLFPSVIAWNVLDGGTDAQDGNNYPGPALQDYAAAVVGAAGNFTSVSDAAIGLSAARLFRLSAHTMWTTSPPTPYSAAAWLDLPEYIRDSIVARGEQAAWEAMTETERAAITHPSLVSIPGGWGGYEHWMAYTPYPDTNSAFENPCLVASNDLRTWVVPDGVVNPIVPPPDGAPYNSDTCLYWDAENTRMVLVFRTRGSGINVLKIMTASTPSEWSSPVDIWTGVIASAEDIASPSIWYNNTSGLWEIVGINVDGGASWPIWKITSADLFSGWSETAEVLSFPHPVAGRRWWHSHFVRLSTGDIVGVAQDNNGTGGATGYCYLARSTDGINFDAALLSGNLQGLYRPTIAPSIRPDADVVVFFSTITGTVFTGYEFRYTAVGPREAEYRRFSEALSAQAFGMAFAALTDDFDLADGTVVGTSSGGQVWTQVSGTDRIGIIGNAATNLTTGNCRVYFDITASNYTIMAQIGAITSECNIILRWVDVSNYLRLQLLPATALLQEVVSGVATTIFSAAGSTRSAGDIVRVENSRDRVQIFVNGVIYGEHLTTRFNTSTSFGLQMSGATGNAKIRAIAAFV
jgi:hypothetical protein